MDEDADEYRLRKAEERADPMRMPDTVDRIEWRLMYGEFGTPNGIWFLGWTIIALLGLILWRIW
jgi:hypothetical protein